MSWRLFAIGENFYTTGTIELWVSEDTGSTWREIDHTPIGDPINNVALFAGCATPRSTNKMYTVVIGLENFPAPSVDGVYSIDLATDTWTLEDDQTGSVVIDAYRPEVAEIWCDATDTLVVQVGAGFQNNVIRARTGSAGTAWVDEQINLDVTNRFLDVHGTVDGSAVFAISHSTATEANYLWKRNADGTWTNVYTTPVGFATLPAYGWTALRVVEPNEVHIIGLDINALEGPAPAAPPAPPGSTETNRIWKWDGVALTPMWQPVSLAPWNWFNRWLDLWMAPDGSEGWALSSSWVFWNGPSAAPGGEWVESIEWVHYDGSVWTTFKNDGYYPYASHRISQIPGDPTSAIAIIYDDGQMCRFDGAQWEDDGDTNDDYWNQLKPKIGGYPPGMAGIGAWITTFDYREYSPAIGHPLYNRSFEDPSTVVGEADWWVHDVSDAAEDIALFTRSEEPNTSFDDFEDSWDDNQNAQAEFGIQDVIYALYEGGTSQQESFEFSWREPATSPPVTFNHQSQWVFDSSNFSWGAFDGLDHEGLESNWGSTPFNQASIFIYASGTFAGGAFGTEDHEGFEEDWGIPPYNQSSITDYAFGTFILALFNGFQARENFELNWSGEVFP